MGPGPPRRLARRPQLHRCRLLMAAELDEVVVPVVDAMVVTQPSKDLEVFSELEPGPSVWHLDYSRSVCWAPPGITKGII